VTRVDARLTEDPIARRTPSARPAHRQWRFLALVAAGGAAGTALREAVSLIIPSLGPLPLATFIINVVGALVLGILLQLIALRGADEGRRRAVRLLIGTGVLGGFTTYSALAAVTAQLMTVGEWTWAIGYALGTVVAGAAASVAGIAAGSWVASRTRQVSA
jgi:CrcB protein